MAECNYLFSILTGPILSVHMYQRKAERIRTNWNESETQNLHVGGNQKLELWTCSRVDEFALLSKCPLQKHCGFNIPRIILVWEIWNLQYISWDLWNVILWGRLCDEQKNNLSLGHHLQTTDIRLGFFFLSRLCGQWWSLKTEAATVFGTTNCKTHAMMGTA